MTLDKYQVMNAILGSRQTRPWDDVFDSIDGERVNMLKEVWFDNPEYTKQENLGVAPTDMRDSEGKRVNRMFHYVVWNYGTTFQMSPLGGFMEPQIVELTAMLGDGAFPFSCEVERLEPPRGQSAGYRIKVGSIGAPELLPELADLMIAAPHDEGAQSLEEYAREVAANAS